MLAMKVTLLISYICGTIMQWFSDVLIYMCHTFHVHALIVHLRVWDVWYDILISQSYKCKLMSLCSREINMYQCSNSYLDFIICNFFLLLLLFFTKGRNPGLLTTHSHSFTSESGFLATSSYTIERHDCSFESLH